MKHPSYLHKVLSYLIWEQSQNSGFVVPDVIDKSFMHLATKEQLDNVLDKYWS